jgi:HEAT repeat protein
LNTSSAPAAAVTHALAALHSRHESAYRKGSYVMALARQAVTSAGRQNLLDALEEASEADLQSMVLVVGWLEDTVVNRALTQMLRRPVARGEAVEALVRKGSQVTELLVEQLEADDRETRQAAVVALGRMGNRSAVPALLAALNADNELTVSVAGALAMIGDERAYAPLLALVGHTDVAVCRAVVSALNSLGHPDMAKDMSVLLRDPRPLVREAAVKIVGYAGYPECADILLERCRDEHDNVRRAGSRSSDA